MMREWIDIVSKIASDVSYAKEEKCPYCKKAGIDYIYVGDEKTRIGYLQIWCDECLKGTYISRVKAPINAKFVSFNDDLEKIIPEYELVD